MCQGKKFITLYRKGDLYCAEGRVLPSPILRRKNDRSAGKKEPDPKPACGCGQPGPVLGVEIEFSVAAPNRAGFTGSHQIVFF